MAGFMTGVGEIFNYAFNSLDMTSSANDIIVIQHADGTLHSSPFIVRFGKVKVLRPQDKVVTIEVNGQPTNAVMKIASDGTAYWVHAADGSNVVGPYDSPIDSPIASPAVHSSPASALPPALASSMDHVGMSPSLLPSNPPPGVRPPPSPATPATPAVAPATAGNEPPPTRGSPVLAVAKGDSPAAVPAAASASLPDVPGMSDTPSGAEGSGVGNSEVKRLDDALPEELLVGSTSKPEAGPVEGLLTSLAAEAAVSPSASNMATPNAVGVGHPLPAAQATHLAFPPPANGGAGLSTGESPSDGGAALEATPDASGLEPSPSMAGMGGLRLARMASTDCLDGIHLGTVSLNEPGTMPPAAAGAAAAAGAEDPTDPTELPLDNATRLALQGSLHVDPAAGLAAAQGQTAISPHASLKGEAQGASIEARADSDEFSDSDDAFHPGGLNLEEAAGRTSGRASAEGPAYTRSVFANHHDLTRLNLNPGANTIRFSTGTTLRGKVDITATVFLWSEGAKLVVSDVDGTVTKSDVMGHIATFFGKDWTHPGLCSLYSKIAKNGYHFVYLTARSVSQVEQTRQFLFNVEQDGTRLPHGPVLTAPEKLFSALTQELSKKSHEFKIACLAQVRDAFPAHIKPFYAGFGNRIGDVIAYTASEVSEHKIFIINKDSVIHICTVKRSYRDLSHMVDETFPARKADDDYLAEFHELRCAAAALNEGASMGTTENRLSATSTADGAAAAAAGFGAAAERSASPGSDGSAPSVTTSSAQNFTASPAPRRTTTRAAAPDAPAEYNDFNFWRVDPAALVEPAPAASPQRPGSATKSSSNGSHTTSPAHGPAGAGSEPQTQSRGWLGGLWGTGKPKPSPKPSDPAASTPASPASDIVRGGS